MNKLDEIETDLQVVNTFMLGIPAQRHIANDRLLIRAVRQLGAIVRERESKSITLNRIEHGSIDPDVLKLLEET